MERADTKKDKLEALNYLVDIFPDSILKMVRFPVLENVRQLILHDEFTQAKLYSFDPVLNTFVGRENLIWNTVRFEELSQNSFITQTNTPWGVQVWEFNSSTDEYRVKLEFQYPHSFEVFGRLLYLYYPNRYSVWNLDTNEGVDMYGDEKWLGMKKVCEDSFYIPCGDKIEFYRILHSQMVLQGSILSSLIGVSGMKHLEGNTYIFVSKEGDSLAEIPLQKGDLLKYKFVHRFLGSIETVVNRDAVLVRKDKNLRLWLRSRKGDWMPSLQNFNCSGSEKQGNFVLIYEELSVSSGVYRWDGINSRLAYVYSCAYVGRPEIQVLSSNLVTNTKSGEIFVSTFSGEKFFRLPYPSPKTKTLPPRPSQISGNIRLLEKVMPITSVLVEIVVRFL